jgi:hypothetical protein
MVKMVDLVAVVGQMQIKEMVLLVKAIMVETQMLIKADILLVVEEEKVVLESMEFLMWVLAEDLAQQAQ